MYKQVEDQDTQSLDILLRQVDNLLTKDGSTVQTSSQTVSYSKLYSVASGGEKCLMITGWLTAFFSGVGMPSFVFLFGNILDAFDPYKNSKTDMKHQINILTLAFALIGVYVWIVTYLYFSCLLIFAEKIVKKIRVKYLECILKQESSWFDLNNPQELPSRMTKECQAIRNALGEKMGTIILAFAMTIAGLAFALSKGWSFSLVVMGAFPGIMITTSILTKTMQGGFKQNMRAYGQSAGYAEQALNAIRVVVAFGQEAKERTNYDRFLKQAKSAGVKTHLRTSIVLAFFMFFIFATYSYSFFMGSVWIYHKIYNDTFKTTYTAGNVLTCFFGVFFGMFCIGMAGPNIKAVTEGLVAGKMAYDIIDRTPKIDQDEPNTTKINLRGGIEFKNVSFIYPSRPDQVILNNFNAVFETGKTTALVGPSGSGKSTIVQLLERFYDPSEGQVLIDGLDLKSINLRDYRQQIGYVGQEPVLFNTSIKQNILLGRPDASDEEIIESLKKANAYDFLVKQGQTIDMHVGQSGGQLSGGQKQRIAIARAFIKKPKMLIFDEATSALDKKNEADVQKSIDSIRNELGQVTTVVIAHRLSTIRNADQILVLKKGKIVEVGNHDTLLKNYPEGVYAQLVQQQEKAEHKEEDESPPQKENEIVYDREEPDLFDPMLLKGKRQEDPPSLQKEEEECKDTLRDDKDDFAIKLQQDGPVETLRDDRPLLTKQQSKGQSFKTKRKHREEKMKEEADLIDKKDEDSEKELLKKIEKTNFMKRLGPYTKPKINAVLGIIASIINGAVFPTFGVLVTKMLFSLMLLDLEQMKEKSRYWCLWMFICSLVTLIAVFINKFLFGIIGENITLSMRSSLYGAIIQKQISWFDKKENAAGVLTTVLATEAQTVNGASTEGLAVILESFFGLVVGIVLAFCYSWKLSLVALGCVPFMMLGGAIGAKFQAGLANSDESDYKDANLLAGDSIVNYRTVASFAHDNILVEQYDKYVTPPTERAIKKYHCIGAAFGFSQFTQNAVYAVLFWAGSMFMFNDPNTSGEDIFRATFAMMFGAFASGQANQYGPDMGKAKKAAIKIFSYIDTGSKINACEIPEDAVSVPKSFRGEIELKDVWFRYPSRKEWVFKGLNLKINANESVAIVGESGSGKSTLVNLILRFYEPNFGEVLIDNVNIKDYNLQELRKKMGLVMQEPTLFNYTIKENILYGMSNAKESDIYSATQIANALEFIESNELQKCYDDSSVILHKAYVERKEEIVPRRCSEEDYQKKLKQLALLKEKEEREGKFQALKGIMDTREGNEYFDVKLSSGFEIECGLKGSKLSGGQKQRIAIARAVIRRPNILILDEATSALDEDSQRKVQIALDNIMVGRTSIVIAHRLTTVEKCNRVVVIEDGVVAEDGNFNDLKSKKDGYFMKLSENMKNAEQKQ